MWRQADSNTMNLKPMTEYGWVVEDNNVRIIWRLTKKCSINQGKGSCFTKRLQMYNRLYNWQMQLQKEAKRMWRRMSVLELHQH